MRISGGSEPAFKIGWAFDTTVRQRGFNLASIPALGGLSYDLKLTHRWNTARSAFLMEQLLLRHFDKRRHPGNREVITSVSQEELQEAWTSQVLAVKHHQALKAKQRLGRPIVDHIPPDTVTAPRFVEIP
jgi:hypothetical protein